MNDYEFDPEAACEAIREEIEWQIEEWKKRANGGNVGMIELYEIATDDRLDLELRYAALKLMQHKKKQQDKEKALYNRFKMIKRRERRKRSA